MATHSIKRTYTIAFQLGARGSTHRTFGAAIKALSRVRKTARKAGDKQAIYLEVNGGDGLLTDDEAAQLMAL